MGRRSDLIISDLVELVENFVGHIREIFWDRAKPDGRLEKLTYSLKLVSKCGITIVNIDNGIKHL